MRNLVLSVLAIAGLTQTSGCIIGGGDPEGTFSLTWFLVDTADNPLTCADADVDEIELLMTREIDGQGIADQWDCNDGSGETYGLEPGLYTIQVNALRGETAVATGDVFQGEEVFEDEVTDLGSFTIVMDAGVPRFTVEFSVDYGAVGGSENCTELGNGVVQQIIFVYDAGGAQCIAMPLGTPDDPTAATCEPSLCQESTVVQSIELEEGDYDIVVQGLKGATGATPVVCYEGELPISVTGDGDAGSINAPFLIDAPPECEATKPAGPGRVI